MIAHRIGDVELSGPEAALRFVDLLTGSPNGLVAFRTFVDSKGGASLPRKLFGSLSAVSGNLEKAQMDGCGVFAVVNAGGNCDAEINEVRAVFVDADGVSLSGVEWHVPPDMIARRSDTHWHAYWLVTGVSVSEFPTVQKRLAKLYGTDPCVHNLSRVMRVPGYLHLKDPSHPEPYTLIDLTGGDVGDCYRELNGYSQDTICAGLPQLDEDIAPGQPLAAHGSPIAIAHFREMLSFVDPTMKHEHSKWAGMTLAILHDLPLVSDAPIDREQLADDWNSGELWRVRTADQDFAVETYRGREEMLRSAAGKPRDRGSVISLGTFYLLAKEHGYRGVPNDTMALLDAMSQTTSAKNGASGSSVDVYPSYFVDELDAIPPVRCLVEDLIPEDAVSIFYGPSGSLKTFVALDIALSAAAGIPWAQDPEGNGGDRKGFKVPHPLRVAFIAGEGASGLNKRVRAWRKAHNITAGLAVAVIPTMPRFAKAENVDKLIRTISTKLGTVDIVFVDTLMRASSGINVNAPSDAQLIIDACDHIRTTLHSSVVLIHHTGKDRSNGMLGAENFKAAVSTVESIEVLNTGPGQRTVSITQEKFKDGDIRVPVYMRATQETVGRDDNGKNVTSLVLVRCSEPHSPEHSMKAARLLKIREILETRGADGTSMHELAEALVKDEFGGDLLPEQQKKRIDAMRKWLEKEVKGGALKSCASRVGQGRTASWRFRDPMAAAAPSRAAEYAKKEDG